MTPFWFGLLGSELSPKQWPPMDFICKLLTGYLAHELHPRPPTHFCAQSISRLLCTNWYKGLFVSHKEKAVSLLHSHFYCQHQMAPYMATNWVNLWLFQQSACWPNKELEALADLNTQQHPYHYHCWMCMVPCGILVRMEVNCDTMETDSLWTYRQARSMVVSGVSAPSFSCLKPMADVCCWQKAICFPGQR